MHERRYVYWSIKGFEIISMNKEEINRNKKRYRDDWNVFRWYFWVIYDKFFLTEHSVLSIKSNIEIETKLITILINF